VFNPLPPARLVGILSTVLRDSAAWDRPLEPFQAGQLKSASSIGRFAAAEIAHAGPVLDRFRAAVPGAPPDADLATLGEFLCERLAVADDTLRATLHTLLRDLTNAELEILLGATKGGTP
jgi:hypothetical protein